LSKRIYKKRKFLYGNSAETKKYAAATSFCVEKIKKSLLAADLDDDDDEYYHLLHH